jgi:hypothetical protein
MTATIPLITDSNGIEWHTFESWLDVPAQRVIPADLAVRRSGYGLSAERLVKAFSEIKEDLNKGLIVDAYAKFDQLEKRVQDIPDESLLQELACVFILHPDENPDEYSPKMQRTKLELWANDEDTRFFFIQKAVNYITTLSGISDEFIRMRIQQRHLMESADPNKSIFPLAETGLMSS